MIQYNQIEDVHLEIATMCNASCPWCPRNFWGYTYNGGYPELFLTLDQCKTIFSEQFVKQLKTLRINGNFGDIVMNPDGAHIVEYFRSSNDKLEILVNTNGGARNKKFWQQLAANRAVVTFALDGLEDTHHLYRKDTVWSTVIQNAKIFIKAGGTAIWQMIKFNHNLHQIAACKAMSEDLGFMKFNPLDSERNSAPVFDRRGTLVHVLGDYQGETSFPVLFNKKLTDEVLLEDIVVDRYPKASVGCVAKKLKSIYVAANGDISPCCFTGFYPKTYGKGQYHQAANKQLVPLINNNNALKYPLEQCIEWFTQIEKSWQMNTYEQGRLIICDDNCGL